MIMIRKIHTGYVNTAYFSFIIWNCASAFIRMFFIQNIPTQHWRFLPDNSFTRLNLLHVDNLSQSMQWTDCPILTASVLLLYPPLTLLSALPSFHSANSLHILPSLGSQASQPTPALCISMSVCVCMYLSLRARSLLSAHVSYFEISYLVPCLFLPVSWPSRFLPFVGCCMPSLYLRHVCNYT